MEYNVLRDAGPSSVTLDFYFIIGGLTTGEIQVRGM